MGISLVIRMWVLWHHSQKADSSSSMYSFTESMRFPLLGGRIPFILGIGRGVHRSAADSLSASLNRAVRDAYGWPDEEIPAEEEDVVLSRWLTLNMERSGVL